MSEESRSLPAHDCLCSGTSNELPQSTGIRECKIVGTKELLNANQCEKGYAPLRQLGVGCPALNHVRHLPTLHARRCRLYMEQSRESCVYLSSVVAHADNNRSLSSTRVMNAQIGCNSEHPRRLLLKLDADIPSIFTLKHTHLGIACFTLIPVYKEWYNVTQ